MNEGVPVPVGSKGWLVLGMHGGDMSLLVRALQLGGADAHRLWAVTDPGLSDFGGLWREAALAAGIELGVIVVVRHPSEAAGLLAAREGTSTARAMQLWLRHTVAALAVADGLPAVLVSGSGLSSNWRHALAPLARLPGGRLLHWDGQAQEAMDALVDAGSAGPEAVRNDTLPTLVAELWSVLCARAADGGSLEGLASTWSAALARERERLDYSPGGPTSEEHAARLRELQAENIGLEIELEAERAAARLLRHDRAKLERVLASSSWRLTRPLRVLSRLLRGQWSIEDSKAAKRSWGRLTGRGRAQSGSSADAAAEMAVLEVHERAPVLAAKQDGLDDVFFWSVIDWDFRFQRPQHLAKSMARRGHRTFYISNTFIDSPLPGFHADPLDRSGRLFQVQLHLADAPEIYHGLPGAAQVEALRASLAQLLAWTLTPASLSVVQHPYWSPLVRAVPNARVVYDCMDHHAGFENNAASVLAAERALLSDAELVIVTSLWLQHEVESGTRATALVRNACEFEFFSVEPPKRFADPDGRRVIGYYGAIAEWFDLELLRKVAQAYPQALVLLVGSDTSNARQALSGLENVRFVGEIPYPELPFWLYAFDVALLPFKVIPLTLATNPVKVYEYLAAGKPVVAVDLPEMAQFRDLVRVASGHDDFVAAIGEALAAPATGELALARRDFAAGQTWAHRAEELESALDEIVEPLVSLVVLTYNNLAITEACLSSIESCSEYRHLEVIVVDNASTDGSRAWLQAWVAETSAAGHRRRLILNEANLGFAAGNNLGLAAAEGEVLVMLNNDTYVTRGWVRTLCAHFRRDPKLGLLGPVTNNIGNEARIDLAYDDMPAMQRAAGAYTRAHPGALFPLRTAAFFCVAMPRRVYQRVGGLDEAFGIGFFEDDDYCRRVEQAGWKIACAEDVFVHHHLSASFDALGSEAKQKLFERNKAVYESKWGAWRPHAYRTSATKART